MGWDCELVEANKTGIEETRRLFKERNITDDSYALHESRIEDYKTEKQYDIVIAEGFLQHLPNQKEVIHKLKSLVNNNGLIVITCADEVSVFVEAVKRLYATVFAGNTTDFGEKVKILCNVFEPQLKMLPGVSRPT